MEAYVVTGAAGFIGSNLVRALNSRGIKNIIAVDDLTEGNKFLNLVDADIMHYFDKKEFIEAVCESKITQLYTIKAVFHEGACSDTMNHDGHYMMANNYQYTVDLFNWCQDNRIPFLYASSAAVYGRGRIFKESREFESPLNVYGYSKFLFDQYLRFYLTQHELTAQVAGFRYFNVYGINENHKGKMASVVFHHFNQYREKGYVELFGAYDNYAAGEQTRDFVSVEDVVKVNLFFLDHPEKTGIFNLGTGLAQSFNELARSTINGIRATLDEDNLTLDEMLATNLIRYIDFPEALKNKYQSYTQADITALREIGYQDQFLNLAEGVARYINLLVKNENR